MLVIFAESFAQFPFSVLTEIEQFSGVDPYNYSAIARYDEKSGAYVVSDKSKALQMKHINYVPFGNLSSDLLGRMSVLYKGAIRQLKQLQSENTGKFISWSRLQPPWFTQNV